MVHSRVPDPERDPRTRVRDYHEIFGTLPNEELRRQGSRCMDCGVPFCNSACPLGNLIPDWNDLVRRDDWEAAIGQLHATNNFPEFTGLICPAPCESACVLDIADDAGDDQADRVLDRRPGVQRGLDHAAAAELADRQDGRRHRLRARRARRRRRAEPGRPPGHRLRARRGRRRPDAIRRPRREAREVDDRPPRRAARGRGRRSSSAASTSAARSRPRSCDPATTRS